MPRNNNNRLIVPQARQLMDQFKLEIANELGLTNYDKIDKGQLTARDNGYVGGTMVKKMVENYQRNKNE